MCIISLIFTTKPFNRCCQTYFADEPELKEVMWVAQGSKGFQASLPPNQMKTAGHWSGSQISVAASFLVSCNVHWLSQCWIKQQKFVFSKFWRLEVQNQGATGLLFSETPLPSFQLLVALSSHALPSVLPCVPLYSFF